MEKHGSSINRSSVYNLLSSKIDVIFGRRARFDAIMAESKLTRVSFDILDDVREFRGLQIRLFHALAHRADQKASPPRAMGRVSRCVCVDGSELGVGMDVRRVTPSVLCRTLIITVLHIVRESSTTFTSFASSVPRQASMMRMMGICNARRMRGLRSK